MVIGNKLNSLLLIKASCQEVSFLIGKDILLDTSAGETPGRSLYRQKQDLLLFLSH